MCYNVVYIWKYVQKTEKVDVKAMEENVNVQQEMKFCSECGQKIMKKAVICPHCGCQIGAPTVKSQPQIINNDHKEEGSKKFVRFLRTFFLGWIGSMIINHTSLKPKGFTSRTLAYFFLAFFTFGIYPIVASVCNLSFDPSISSNIGYIKD